jgi:hypothetical protein
MDRIRKTIKRIEGKMKKEEISFEDKIFDKIGWYKNRYNLTRTKSEYDLIANAIKLSRNKALDEVEKLIFNLDLSKAEKEKINSNNYKIYIKDFIINKLKELRER